MLGDSGRWLDGKSVVSPFEWGAEILCSHVCIDSIGASPKAPMRVVLGHTTPYINVHLSLFLTVFTSFALGWNYLNGIKPLAESRVRQLRTLARWQSRGFTCQWGREVPRPHSLHGLYRCFPESPHAGRLGIYSPVYKGTYYHLYFSPTSPPSLCG